MIMNKNIKEMGDGFYIVTEEGSNGMGGFAGIMLNSVNTTIHLLRRNTSQSTIREFPDWLMVNGKRHRDGTCH